MMEIMQNLALGKSACTQDLVHGLHYGQNAFCPLDTSWLSVVTGAGGTPLTWGLAREVTSVRLGSQSPSAAHLKNELQGS